MTMQPRPNNPIQQRKDQVRKHARNGVISVAAGVGGGLLLAFLMTPSSLFLILGFVIAVVGGGYNAYKVNRIVNHKD